MTKPKRPEQIGIMKAQPLSENLLNKLGPSCYAQPKFRGQRCRTVWIEDEEFPVLLSSYGNPFFFLEHIQAALSSLPRLPYDGELYVHEFSQQEINSVCNRTVNAHKDALRVEYYIFDLVSRGTQEERLTALRCALPEIGSVRRCPTELIETTQWPRHCEDYLAHGYEGIILRALRNAYSPLDGSAKAQRPTSILKFKPNEYDEYLILSTREGEGWATGMLGAFFVQGLEGGASFYVGTGPELTKAKRQRYWAIRDELVGKKLLVRHERNVNTADGIPICTSAYEVRGI